MNIYYYENATPDLEDAGYTKPGWYFWDETDAYCHGPFETEEQAREALRGYEP